MQSNEDKTIAYPPGWQEHGPYEAPTGGQSPPVAPTVRQDALGGSAPAPGRGPLPPGLQRTVVIGREEGVRPLAWLVITRGPYRGRLFQLTDEAMTLGRDYQCEIVIDDETVSRQHARIKVQTEGDHTEFYLYDMASTAGVTVNGAEVVKHCLQDGDEIVLGQSHLVFKRV